MLHILVAENDIKFRRTLCGILRRHLSGIVVAEAGNSQEVLLNAESLRPDLIVMDINLPDENGLETAKAIKTRYPNMAIIILASHDLPEYRQAAFRAGANCLLAKGSANLDDVLAMVEGVSFVKQLHDAQ